MKHSEAKPIVDLLERAKHEIEQLRRRNEVLSAKVDTMDLMACVLFAKPSSQFQAQPQSVDVCWEIGSAIGNIKQNVVAALPPRNKPAITQAFYVVAYLCHMQPLRRFRQNESMPPRIWTQTVGKSCP